MRVEIFWKIILFLGVFDKIKAGFQYANDYLETVKEVANLVAKSLNSHKKQSDKRGDRTEDQANQDFGTSNFISGFFRLLGLDSRKLAAITVNSAIFLAQMVKKKIKSNDIKTKKYIFFLKFDCFKNF